MRTILPHTLLVTAFLLSACNAQTLPEQQETVLQLLGGSNSYEAPPQETLLGDITFETSGAWTAAITYLEGSGWVKLNPETACL